MDEDNNKSEWSVFRRPAVPIVNQTVASSVPLKTEVYDETNDEDSLWNVKLFFHIEAAHHPIRIVFIFRKMLKYYK
jgi:hypothetical protein